MTTSLVCEVAAGTATTGRPEAEAASLRGELCCVDTKLGLRPFTGHGSPEGHGHRRTSITAGELKSFPSLFELSY